MFPITSTEFINLSLPTLFLLSCPTNVILSRCLKTKTKTKTKTTTTTKKPTKLKLNL